MLLSSAGTALASHDFPDVPTGHQFHEDISWLVDAGATEGFPDGEFKPGRVVTRQAAVAFLYRLAGSPDRDFNNDFPDVPESHQFHDAISWAFEQGITEGYEDGTFRPGTVVTRQAAAAFIFRAVGEPEGTWDSDFPDVGEGHPFYRAISWLATENITEGYPDGEFKPGTVVTRQAIAAFLHRTAEAGYEIQDTPPVDPDVPIDPGAATIDVDPTDDVNPYEATHMVTASDSLSDGQDVRFEVYSRSNAGTVVRDDGTIRTVAPLIAGEVIEVEDGEADFDYMWDSFDADHYQGENHVIVACVVTTGTESCTTDDWLEIDPVTGQLRNIQADDFGAAEKQWQRRTANDLQLSQEFDANFISEVTHTVQVDVFDQFDGDEYLDFDEAGDRLGPWDVRVDVFRFNEDGEYVGHAVDGSATAPGPASADFGTATYSYDHGDFTYLSATSINDLPVDEDGNVQEFDDVIVTCSDGVGPCAVMAEGLSGEDQTEADLNVLTRSEVDPGNFPQSNPGFSDVPRFPTDMVEKEWVKEELIIVGEDNTNLVNSIPDYLVYDEDGDDANNTPEYDGFEEYDDAVTFVPGQGTDLSWENELEPFGAVNDLAARYGSSGVIGYSAFHGETGLAQTVGYTRTVGEIPMDGSPAGSNFHVHSGAVDETGGIILSLINPDFLEAEGTGETVREDVDFSDFANEGPFRWDLDGKVQDRDASAELSSMISATTGWSFDESEDEIDDSVDWYFNVHSVNDSAGEHQVSDVRTNTNGEVRGQLPHGANDTPDGDLGFGHELPPIFQQVDVPQNGGVRYLEDQGDGTFDDVTDEVLDGTQELPDATITAVQEVELTFNEEVSNLDTSPFVDEIDEDDFTVTVNGDEVDVELASDWRTPNETHTIWIDEIVELGDIVEVTIDEDAAGDIHGWDFSSSARDLSDSVLTRAHEVGETRDGLGGFGEITGTVTNADTDEGIAGATVSADGETATTGPDGNYSMRVDAGEYDVTADHPNYSSETEEDVEVAEFESTTVDFELEPEASGIEGLVTDEDTGFGIGGVTVTVYDDDNELGTTNTSSDGEFQFDLPAGEYDISLDLEHPSYTDEIDEAENDVGNTVVLVGEYTDIGEFDMDRETGTITGTVTEEDGGETIEDALVTLQTDAGTETTRTDASGEYAFTDVDPGNYTVTAEADGTTDVTDADAFDADSETDTLAANGSATEDLQLPSNVTVDDVVYNDGGGGSDAFGDGDGDTLIISFDNEVANASYGTLDVQVTLDNGSTVTVSCDTDGLICEAGGSSGSLADQLHLHITSAADYAADGGVIVQNMFDRELTSVTGGSVQVLDLNSNPVNDPATPIEITSA